MKSRKDPLTQRRARRMPRVRRTGCDGIPPVTSLWNRRRTLLALARHDARRTYAGTTAGRLWTLLTPLIPFVVLTVVFSLGLRLSLNGAPYVYAFAAAYVPWIFITAA